MSREITISIREAGDNVYIQTTYKDFSLEFVKKWKASFVFETPEGEVKTTLASNGKKRARGISMDDVGRFTISFEE